LIFILIKTNQMDQVSDLRQIVPEFFTEVSIVVKILEYYLSGNNLESSVTYIDELKKMEPMNPFIPHAEAELQRIKAYLELQRSGIEIDQIGKLSGIEFEKLVHATFVQMGLPAEITKHSGDFGADIIVSDFDGTRIAIQCKRFNSRVNLKAVQEVLGALGHYGCDCGIVITNNEFMASAVTLAKSHDVELWGSTELTMFLAKDVSFSKFFIGSIDRIKSTNIAVQL
jgi:restriction endonuclease Mrr